MAWSFHGRLPVYKQIVSHIRADILNGKYQPDEQVPPVRQLAIEAGVNPNTMQRALQDLESERLFVTKGTVGRFVTSDKAVLEEAREVMRCEAVAQIIEQANALGISSEELVRYIHQIAPPSSPATPTSDKE